MSLHPKPDQIFDTIDTYLLETTYIFISKCISKPCYAHIYMLFFLMICKRAMLF